MPVYGDFSFRNFRFHYLFRKNFVLTADSARFKNSSKAFWYDLMIPFGVTWKEGFEFLENFLRVRICVISVSTRIDFVPNSDAISLKYLLYVVTSVGVSGMKSKTELA